MECSRITYKMIVETEIMHPESSALLLKNGMEGNELRLYVTSLLEKIQQSGNSNRTGYTM